MCFKYFLENKNAGMFISKEGFGKACEGIHEQSQELYKIAPLFKNSSKQNKRKRKNMRKRDYFTWFLNDGLPYYRSEKPEVPQSTGKVRRKGNMYVDGINSKFYGKHAIRNNTRRQKFLKNHLTSSVFYNHFQDVFDDYEVDVDRNVVVQGCWETNRHTLQRQMIPESHGDFTATDETMDIRALDRHVRNVLRKLKISLLPKVQKNDMLFCSFNLDAYAGFKYDNYLRRPYKRQVIPEAVRMAYKRWDKITEGNFNHESIYPSLYTIGARNKRDFTYDDNEVASSRVVHMPEMHVEMTSGPWTDQITEGIKNLKEGPIFIGNSLLDSQRLNKVLERSNIAVEGDWKRYDSTLYSRMIIAATAILRCFYEPDDQEIDNHFIAILDSLLIKDYYTPGGNLYRLYHGLPSGVKSTNLIGSLINMIALDFCCNSGSNRKFDYVTGGDDFLIGARIDEREVDAFLDKLDDRSKKIGMQFKFLKVKYHKSEYVEDLPCFYKYSINKSNDPVIPTSAMLERVFLPWNKSYSDIKDIYQFLVDVMPSLGHPSSSLMLFYMYFKYIYFRTFHRSISLHQVILRHQLVYNKMIEKKKIERKYETGIYNCLSSYFSYYPNLITQKYTDISCFARSL